eukprot:s1163_g22.t1
MLRSSGIFFSHLLPKGFDHHCRYLNVCVGGRSYPAWFSFVALLFVLMVMCSFAHFHLLSDPSSHDLHESQPVVFYIFASIAGCISSMESLFLLALLAQHTYFCLVGITTLEYIKDQASAFPGLPPNGWREAVERGECFDCGGLLELVEPPDVNEVLYCSICQGDVAKAGVVCWQCDICDLCSVCPLCYRLASSTSTVVTYRAGAKHVVSRCEQLGLALYLSTRSIRIWDGRTVKTPWLCAGSATGGGAWAAKPQEPLLPYTWTTRGLDFVAHRGLDLYLRLYQPAGGERHEAVTALQKSVIESTGSSLREYLAEGLVQHTGSSEAAESDGPQRSALPTASASTASIPAELTEKVWCVLDVKALYSFLDLATLLPATIVCKAWRELDGFALGRVEIAGEVWCSYNGHHHSGLSGAPFLFRFERQLQPFTEQYLPERMKWQHKKKEVTEVPFRKLPGRLVRARRWHVVETWDDSFHSSCGWSHTKWVVEAEDGCRFVFSRDCPVGRVCASRALLGPAADNTLNVPLWAGSAVVKDKETRKDSPLCRASALRRRSQAVMGVLDLTRSRSQGGGSSCKTAWTPNGSTSGEQREHRAISRRTISAVVAAVEGHGGETKDTWTCCPCGRRQEEAESESSTEEGDDAG